MICRAVILAIILLFPGCLASKSVPDPIRVSRLPLDGARRQPILQLLQNKTWQELSRAIYLNAIKKGDLVPGLLANQRLEFHKPTLIFVHGAKGSPSDFSKLTSTLDFKVNISIFLYDDRDRIAPNAELLRTTIMLVPQPVMVVAHSMGTLLVAYIGATDPDRSLCSLSAIYLNPLIGGSYLVDGFRGTGWHSPLYPLVKPLLITGNLQDLLPRSDFQQQIFGESSTQPCFSDHTIILFTDDPGIKERRVSQLFKRTKEQLLRRMAADTVLVYGEKGARSHRAPLLYPDLVLPYINQRISRFVLNGSLH